MKKKETNKTKEQGNKTKIWFFQKINKIDTTLLAQFQKKYMKHNLIQLKMKMETQQQISEKLRKS